ncbi:MAG: transposase [Myxococcota bacterium]|nr:transposase [Myxococcota bacterium]
MRRVLQEADACTESGQVGALVRREGLYSPHLTTWRQARERRKLEGLAPKKRGPKAQEPNPLAKELATERREVARLKAGNAKLQIICDVKKKLAAFGGDVADDSRGRREQQGS